MPHILYFGKLACCARNLWLRLSSRCEEVNKDTELATMKEYGKLETLIDQSKQLLLYIDEIIKALPELSNVFFTSNSKVIANALLHFAIYPLLIAQFKMGKEKHLSDSIALLLLNQVITNIEYKPLLDPIVRALIESGLNIKEMPEDVRTYLKPWRPFEFKDDLDCKCLE